MIFYMEKILIATDLDGTLIGDDEKVSEKNLEAMRKAVDMGIYVVPTTGRSYYEMPEVLRSVKPFTHCICSDGAVLFHKDGDKIAQELFSRETAQDIYEILSDYDTMTELYIDGVPVTDVKYLTDEGLEYFRVEENYKSVIRDTHRGVADSPLFFKDNFHRVEMFNVFFHDYDEREEAFKRLGEIEEIETTTSMRSNIEILRKSVNKGTGLTALCRILGVKKENVYVMGDSRNDISMFKAAGTGCSVKNACLELKAAADRIICSNNENAFDFILKLVMKERRLVPAMGAYRAYAGSSVTAHI